MTGLRWANPFYTKGRISLRVRNFESERLKVNDTDGNPRWTPPRPASRWTTSRAT